MAAILKTIAHKEIKSSVEQTPIARIFMASCPQQQRFSFPKHNFDQNLEGTSNFFSVDHLAVTIWVPAVHRERAFVTVWTHLRT